MTKKSKKVKPSDEAYVVALQYQERSYVYQDVMHKLGEELQSTKDKIKLFEELYALCQYEIYGPVSGEGTNSAAQIRLNLHVYRDRLEAICRQLSHNEERARKCIRDYETIPRKANRGAKRSRKPL